MSACILRQNPDIKNNGWDEEFTVPIDWTVGTFTHLRVGDRAFFIRSGPHGGLFASGEIEKPDMSKPGRKSVPLPKDCAPEEWPVFECAANYRNQPVKQVDVRADIPHGHSGNSQRCSVSHPVLISMDELKEDKRFGWFFRKLAELGQAGSRNGTKVDKEVEEPLLEALRERCSNLQK